MAKSRAYSHPEYGFTEEAEYPTPYTNTRRATYPSYAPTQAPQSSKGYRDQFSLSDHTLVDDRHHPSESRSWRSNSSTNPRDPVLPLIRSHEPTQRPRKNAPSPPTTENHSTPTKRRKKSRKPKDTVYIDKLTISANGPPLETHLRNTKGNVHIKHLRIEDTPTHSSHRRSKQRRSQPRQHAEKETESASKLTRICELACVVSLLLQWKEYKEYKNERSQEREIGTGV